MNWSWPSAYRQELGDHWVDVGSALLATLCGIRRSFLPGITRKRVIDEFFSGAALFPFLLMAAAVVQSHLLTAVENRSHLTFFLSGGIGVIWIVGELLKP